jgi:hypothetical protein
MYPQNHTHGVGRIRPLQTNADYKGASETTQQNYIYNG